VELTETSRVSTRIQFSERTLSLVALGALMLLGLALRLYNLSPVAWVPDHYERLIEVRAMLEGELPSSAIYTPGFSLVLLVPSAVFGVSVSTMQLVTIVFGLSLIPMVYLLVVQVTQDRFAAFIASGLCATSPFLLHTNRFAFVDSVATTLAIVALYAVPRLKSQSLLHGAAFGICLGLLFLLRQSNAVLILPLVLYWMLINKASLRPTAWLSLFATPLWIASASVFLTISLIATIPSNWFGSNTGEFAALDNVPANLGAYLLQLTGLFATPLLAPLAFGGIRALREQNANFLVAAIGSIIALVTVCSPLAFANSRYIDIGLVMSYAFVGVGLSALLRSNPRDGQSRPMRLIRAWGIVSAPLLFLAFLVQSGSFVEKWHSEAARTDYGLAKEISPIIDALPGNSLLVASTGRAMVDSTRRDIELLDLLDLSLRKPDRERGSEELLRAISLVAEAERPVFYLYTHLEADPENAGGAFGGHDHDIYLDFLINRYLIREIWRSEGKHSGKYPWILYEVSSRDQR
jgi:hypothetical protein